MKAVPFIDLKAQYKKIGPEIQNAVKKVFESQRFVLGECCAALERSIAKKTGARFAVGVASGSDALYLALVALGVGAGDEVITTPFSFFATAGAVSRTGARPVFADIDARTFNLNPDGLESKISRRTKAILPVHLFGLPCDMGPILSIAKKNSLFVIEDAAQAFGAEYKGKKAGSMGDAGCLSFYPTKNLGGAGDGGMIVTSSLSLAQKLKKLRDHGQSKKYFHESVGVNSRLDEIQAATLAVKLKFIDRWNRARRAHARAYDTAFRGLAVRTPLVPAGARHVYHLYSVLTSRRDALAKFLKKKGVETGVYYPIPLHLQPCYKNLGTKKGDCPVAEKTSREILSLPMYPELSAGERERVARAVQEFF
ncbi:MAG: DegT/DnrJ/EryC1/StrS family aminotransferase [Candidatus Omnitrophica bacterium]|nr:DegT/DnrJ/EryC1/StrS family aminotransferase [Candidatus Omnitrophota bacterium]